MSDVEFLFEVVRHGHALRIAAIEPKSLIEITFQAPVGTPDYDLRRLAARKLARAIEAKRARKEDERPGMLV